VLKTALPVAATLRRHPIGQMVNTMASGATTNERVMQSIHETFLFYGDPEAPYWFLGLEEGYQPPEDRPIDDVIRSLSKKADKQRRQGKVSLRAFVKPSKYLPPIDPNAAPSGADVKYQPTWGGYIKLLFAIENANAGKAMPWHLRDVRRYQKYRLGSLEQPKGGKTEMPSSCLMELFDLPCNRRLGRWPYAKLADRKGLAYLKTHKSYRDRVLGDRVALLLAHARLHRPEFLICFGEDCRKTLRTALDDRTNEEVIEIKASKRIYRASLIEIEGTRLVFARHPTAPGTPSAYWVKLGRALADRRDRGAMPRAA